MPDFKQIHAWQRAHALGIALHKLTSGFVPVGHANLRAKLTRAADSIASTIAEGCGAATAKEFARFLEMSIKSANDTEAICYRPAVWGSSHAKTGRSAT